MPRAHLAFDAVIDLTAGGATEEWFDLVSVTDETAKGVCRLNKCCGDPMRGMLTSDDVVTAKEYVIKPKKLIADLFRFD